jgi:hypothetical protein
VPNLRQAGLRPRRRAGLIAAPIDDETVLYDRDADVVHWLDPPATKIWRRLDGRTTLAEIAEKLAAQHRTAAHRVRQDVMKLARVLEQGGLLDGSTPSHHPRVRSEAGSSTHLLPRGVTAPAVSDLPEAPYMCGPFRAVDHAFDVTTNHLETRRYLDEIFSDLAYAAPQPDRYRLLDTGAASLNHRYVLLHGEDLIAATSWLDRALAVLLWHVNQQVVRRSASRHVLVHAAAATTVDGPAVMLPAPAESGKSTTVAGLVQAGFGYLTDEVVAIDPITLAAQPYAKPLSIDRGSWQVLARLRPWHADRISGQWQVPAGRIRPGAVSGPAPVRLVVAPAYRRGAVTTLQPVSRGQMLLTLADSTFAFREAPERNLRVLARLLAGCDCYRLTVGDLDEAVRLVSTLEPGAHGQPAEFGTVRTIPRLPATIPSPAAPA